MKWVLLAVVALGTACGEVDTRVLDGTDAGQARADGGTRASCLPPMSDSCATDADCCGGLTCEYSTFWQKRYCIASCGSSNECPVEFPSCVENMLYLPQCCPSNDVTRCQDCRTDADCPPATRCQRDAEGQRCR